MLQESGLGSWRKGTLLYRLSKYMLLSAGPHDTSEVRMPLVTDCVLRRRGTDPSDQDKGLSGAYN